MSPLFQFHLLVGYIYLSHIRQVKILLVVATEYWCGLLPFCNNFIIAFRVRIVYNLITK